MFAVDHAPAWPAGHTTPTTANGGWYRQMGPTDVVLTVRTSHRRPKHVASKHQTTGGRLIPTATKNHAARQVVFRQLIAHCNSGCDVTEKANN